MVTFTAPFMSDFSLHQSIAQQQTLTPQMRKSLEILQAGTMELSQIINQALEINPVLEDRSDSLSLDENSADPEEADSLAHLNETDDDWRELSITKGMSNNWSAEDEERRQHAYDSITTPVTLQQHLKQQLDESMVDAPVRSAAEALLGNLDERGFLDMPVNDFARHMALPAHDLSAALALIQSFDPPGIGAAGIEESLLLQLERTGGKETIEYQIVRDHLQDLARRRLPHIAKVLNISVERIDEAAERIGKLTLNPGSEFAHFENPYILPDVVIERNESGQLGARLTGESLPDLRISDFYKDMIAKSGVNDKARQYLRDQIREGRSLIKAISLRQETILAIAHKIVEHQPEFFDKGTRHLRPMTMTVIADELQMHATTVSRAVAGKYVLTPHGLLEMRSFFATGYQTDGGEEVSNAGVREAIQQLVAKEYQGTPLTDEALCEALAKQGITVARRTVSKYREQLGILPSHLRKTF